MGDDFIMKKAIQLLIAVIFCCLLASCTRKDTTEKPVVAEPEDFYVIKNEVTLPYEISWSNDIRCTEDTIYIGGYSGTADIDYAFSVYDAETETFKHLDRFRNYKGDVTSAYLGKSRICAAYIKENESYFVVCDAETGEEIKKIETEPGKRITSFFEDENGRLIAQFTGNTGRPEIVS